MSRKIKHILEYLFVRWIIVFFDLFSYQTSRKLGTAILGWLTYKVGGSRRRMVDRNLATAFPEMGAEKRQAMVRDQFRNVGKIAAEFVKLPRFDDAWIERYVDWEPTGLAHIKDCLDRGQGIVINSAHMGNWELMHTILPMKLNIEITAIAAPISNPYTHNYVWNNRKRDFIHFVPPDEMGPGVIKQLKQGKTFMIASDQSAGNRGIFMPYFGVPSSTHTGASQIAYVADAEMIFVVALRLPQGRFRFEMVSLGRGREWGKDKEEAIHILTSRYIDLLEKYVRKYPDQYFWLHNRWKIKAPEDAEIWERLPSDLHPYDT